jgi:hypothetical protein
MCARLAFSIALSACASSTPTERERALRKLPSQAQMVAAADGTALAPLRPVIDAARPFIPKQLDCVLDAALTSEATAISVDPGVGATIVIVTRAHVARCAPLSRIATDMFAATIGAGRVADTPAASPLEDPRWSRARAYLIRDPIAIAIERDGQRMLAVAQPKPLAAWLTIDAAELAPIERVVRTWIDRQRSTGLARVGEALTVKTRGSQLLVQADKLRADDLALVATDVLRALETAPPVPVASFACPALGNGIVRCSGNQVVVANLATALRKLVEVETQPVVAGGDILGIRLSEDAEVLLRRGDVITGLDGHRITSASQLHELARYVATRATLAVRRDGGDLVIELTE